MKKSIFAFVCVLLASTSGTVCMAAGSATATHALKPHHQGLRCQDCHREANPRAPTVVQCTQCHGTAENVAKLTEKQHKPYYNPHNSLHYATYADCVLCHREHSASRLDCNNSNCHKEFTYKVP